jgi:hypothetical protein
MVVYREREADIYCRVYMQDTFCCLFPNPDEWQGQPWHLSLTVDITVNPVHCMYMELVVQPHRHLIGSLGSKNERLIELNAWGM